MKKFFAAFLSLAMLMSLFVTVNAEESTVISVGKTVIAGIDGTGTEADDMAEYVAEAKVMVDGDSTLSTWDKGEMWFLHSTNTQDTIYLNVDLSDAYMITKIVWSARFDSSSVAKQDYQGMKIYGANKADYSDKTLIYTVGTDLTAQTVEFTIADADIDEYRYIRFEKTEQMGGQELSVYGYQNPESNASLSSLAVDGYDFDSDFEESDTEYTIYSDGFPTNNTVTVTASAEDTDASITGAGAVTVGKYGINSIPVTVTSQNGKITKTYTINFVITSISIVSTGATATKVVSTTETDVSTLFNGTGNVASGGSASIGATFDKQTGYIQVDLKKQYCLTEFVWVRYNQGTCPAGIKVWASNDSEFGTYEELGVTDGTYVKSGNKYTCTTALNSSGEYRYVRIVKDSDSGNYFYPTKMDLYALPEIAKVSEDGTTTVTIPCAFYAVGDKIVTVIYNEDGTVKSETSTTAPNAQSTTLTITRADEESAKIFIRSSDDTVERMVIPIENQIVINPAKVTQNGEEIASLEGVTGEITITKEILSNKSTAEYVVPIAAIRDMDGTLRKIAIGEKQKIAQSETEAQLTVSIDVPADSDTKDLYLYLWNGISTMIPFTKAEPVIIGNSASLYLMGDSLCAKYDTSIAQRGWGMYMQDAFDGHINVVNCAKGGNKLSDVLAEENASESYSWSTIKSKLQKGDYVIVNLGYNERNSSDFTQYKANLATIYNEGKALGVTVIFVTPSTDVSSTAAVTPNTTLAVTAAMKEAAASTGAVCLDLNTAVWKHYQEMSPTDPSLQIIKDTYYLSKAYLTSIGITDPATQGWSAAIKNNGQDLVHMNPEGAKMLCDTIITLLKQSNLSLRAFAK